MEQVDCNCQFYTHELTNCNFSVFSFLTHEKENRENMVAFKANTLIHKCDMKYLKVALPHSPSQNEMYNFCVYLLCVTFYDFNIFIAIETLVINSPYG